MSEEFQYRVTEDGVVHRWRRGEEPPPEARRDICPRCLEERKIAQELRIQKTEFSGQKGKVRRDYVCPVCGYKGRPTSRQKRNLTRGTLKEPER